MQNKWFLMPLLKVRSIDSSHKYLTLNNKGFNPVWYQIYSQPAVLSHSSMFCSEFVLALIAVVVDENYAVSAAAAAAAEFVFHKCICERNRVIFQLSKLENHLYKFTRDSTALLLREQTARSRDKSVAMGSECAAKRMSRTLLWREANGRSTFADSKIRICSAFASVSLSWSFLASDFVSKNMCVNFFKIKFFDVYYMNLHKFYLRVLINSFSQLYSTKIFTLLFSL